MGRWKIGGNMKNMQKEPEAFVFEPEEEEHKSANPTELFGGNFAETGRKSCATKEPADTRIW